MTKKIIRNLNPILLAVLLFAQLTIIAQAQTNNQGPLAYIDGTGNVRVVSAGNAPGTAITQDGNFAIPQPSTLTHGYTHLRWSPDGSKLAFQDFVTGNLFV